MLSEEKKAIEILKNEKSNLYILTQTKFTTCTVEQAKAKREAINVVLNLITKLQKENEEKDRQIDLMADEISYLDWGNLCNRINNNCIVSIKHNPKCRECIKQYFEKLAKEKGE